MRPCSRLLGACLPDHGRPSLSPEIEAGDYQERPRSIAALIITDARGEEAHRMVHPRQSCWTTAWLTVAWGRVGCSEGSGHYPFASGCGANCPGDRGSCQHHGRFRPGDGMEAFKRPFAAAGIFSASGPLVLEALRRNGKDFSGRIHPGHYTLRQPSRRLSWTCWFAIASANGLGGHRFLNFPRRCGSRPLLVLSPPATGGHEHSSTGGGPWLNNLRSAIRLMKKHVLSMPPRSHLLVWRS